MSKSGYYMKSFYYSWIIALLIQCESTPENHQPLNQFYHPELKEIYQLQDRRQGMELIPWLDHQDSTIRRHAALALASVQDIQTAQGLLESLEDPVNSVRQAAAYAIGQLKDTTLQQKILPILESEPNPEVRAVLLEALGKCSGTRGLQTLAAWKAKSPKELSGLSWGLYRTGLRGLYSEESISVAINFLRDPQEETRLAAAHYLARTQGLELGDYFQELRQASGDVNPEIRMAIALAFERSGEHAVETLLDLALHDPDHRVRVNAIRALCSSAQKLPPMALIPAISDPFSQVQVAAAEYYSNCADPTYWNAQAIDSLLIIADTTGQYRVRSLLWGTIFKLPQQGDRIMTQIAEEFERVTDPYKRSHLVTALSNHALGKEFLKKVAFDEFHPAVTTAAMNGLVNLDQDTAFANSSNHEFLELYQNAIASNDVALIGIAAMALRDQNLKYRDLVTDLTFLDEALQKLTLPRDMETYQELQRTKAYLSGIPEEVIENPYNNSIDWNLVEQIPEGQKMLIRTTKGDIEIELLIDESPGTVAYFWQLINEGFYENKTFHRVVPNFVVQGGCPRGDGWGSTDSSIRSELGPRKYRRGSVGVASAGKDTESCQWFITHSPTPHLDGRYTIFALVSSGMEIVQQLEIGDTILDITPVNNEI